MNTFRALVLAVAATLALAACVKKESKAPTPSTELSDALNRAVEHMQLDKLPMGKDVWGKPAAVFGRNTVPANTAINAPGYTVEYLIELDTSYNTTALVLSRRYDRGAGDSLRLSRHNDGTWGIYGWGNFETDMVKNVDAQDRDYESRKRYILAIINAAEKCSVDKTSC